MANDAWATIGLRRRVAVIGGAAWPYRVFLDGRQVDALAIGERCEHYVLPGTHRLEVRLTRRTRSAPIELVVVAGDVVELQCRDRGFDSGCIVSMMRGFLRPGTSLIIERLPSPSDLFGDEPGRRPRQA